MIVDTLRYRDSHTTLRFYVYYHCVAVICCPVTLRFLFGLTRLGCCSYVPRRCCCWIPLRTYRDYLPHGTLRLRLLRCDLMRYLLRCDFTDLHTHVAYLHTPPCPGALRCCLILRYVAVYRYVTLRFVDSFTNYTCPEFRYFDDVTTLLTLHCYLFPIIRWEFCSISTFYITICPTLMILLITLFDLFGTIYVFTTLLRFHLFTSYNSLFD